MSCKTLVERWLIDRCRAKEHVGQALFAGRGQHHHNGSHLSDEKYVPDREHRRVQEGVSQVKTLAFGSAKFDPHQAHPDRGGAIGKGDNAVGVAHDGHEKREEEDAREDRQRHDEGGQEHRHDHVDDKGHKALGRHALVKGGLGHWVRKAPDNCIAIGHGSVSLAHSWMGVLCTFVNCPPAKPNGVGAAGGKVGPPRGEGGGGGPTVAVVGRVMRFLWRLRPFLHHRSWRDHP